MKRMAASVVIMLCSACTTGDVGDAEFSSPYPSWTLSPDPTVRIGGGDQRPEYQLFRVVNATRLSDGRLVAANRGSSELRYFDSSGNHLGTVGGAGDGPGEFGTIWDLARGEGDTVLVFSGSNRLSYVSADQEVVATRSFVRSVSSTQCHGEARRHLHPSGSVISSLAQRLGEPCRPQVERDVYRRNALVARFEPESNAVDTLGVFAGTERVPGGLLSFERELVIAVGSRQVYAADSGGNDIFVLSLTGDTVGILGVPWEEQRLSAAAVRARGGSDRHSYSEFYPRVGRMVADPAGGVWVMAYPKATARLAAYQLLFPPSEEFYFHPDGFRWRVVADNGAVVAEVKTPPGLFLLEIGVNYVLGVEQDDIGLESLALYELRREP